MTLHLPQCLATLLTQRVASLGGRDKNLQNLFQAFTMPHSGHVGHSVAASMDMQFMRQLQNCPMGRSAIVTYTHENHFENPHGAHGPGVYEERRKLEILRTRWRAVHPDFTLEQHWMHSVPCAKGMRGNWWLGRLDAIGDGHGAWVHGVQEGPGAQRKKGPGLPHCYGDDRVTKCMLLPCNFISPAEWCLEESYVGTVRSGSHISGRLGHP